MVKENVFKSGKRSFSIFNESVAGMYLIKDTKTILVWEANAMLVKNLGTKKLTYK